MPKDSQNICDELKSTVVMPVVCGNSYTKSISITYKSFYKQILYFGVRVHDIDR